MITSRRQTGINKIADMMNNVIRRFHARLFLTACGFVGTIAHPSRMLLRM
ncbi:hypothetical protein L7G72_12745 [Xenorhabdus bovienii]|nr:hypothetical protein [Xenorhabdus bovienii]MCG3462708.1 hypothetical protein [Xenorhabdus bovienii]